MMTRYRYIAGTVAGIALVVGMMGTRVVQAKTSPRWLTYDARSHTANLTLIAGYNGAVSGFNFNGEGDGRMVITMPRGYHVHVTFQNAGSYPHSAEITYYAQKNRVDGYKAAFPSSTTPNPGGGIVGRMTQHFTFTANRTGTYALVCGVPGHEGAGMWDTVRVVASGRPSLRL